MQAQQVSTVLNVLRGAARELGSSQPCSQPGTPTGQGAGLGATVPPMAPPSTANLLLQISALHKAFLALSEAFMEELDQRATDHEQQRAAVEGVRRECSAKLQAMVTLRADMHELGEADRQAAAAEAALAQRCDRLERELASLRQEGQEGQRRAVDAAAAAATAAVQQQVEAEVSRQLAAAQQRWAAQSLPPLLQPLQEAVGATAELAAQVATEVGGLAARMKHLARQCEHTEAAHANHEERVCRLEDGSLAGGGESGGAVAAQQAQQAGQLQQLQHAVRSLQEGHCRLEVTVQQAQQDAQQAQQEAQQAQQQAQQVQARQQKQKKLAQPWGPEELECLVAAAAELPAVHEGLAAVAAQQAQGARTTEELVQSVLADVTALARHTKALDRELRSLRREAQQTQQALLHSSTTFSRALAIPSPLGPFTSFPPQP